MGSGASSSSLCTRTQAGLGGEGRAGRGEPQCQEPTHRSTGGAAPSPAAGGLKTQRDGGGRAGSLLSLICQGGDDQGRGARQGLEPESPGPHAGLGQIRGCPGQAAASWQLGHSGAGVAGPGWLPWGPGGLKTQLCCLDHSARVPGPAQPPPPVPGAKDGTAAARSCSEPCCLQTQQGIWGCQCPSPGLSSVLAGLGLPSTPGPLSGGRALGSLPRVLVSVRAVTPEASPESPGAAGAPRPSKAFVAAGVSVRAWEALKR